MKIKEVHLFGKAGKIITDDGKIYNIKKESLDLASWAITIYLRDGCEIELSIDNGGVVRTIALLSPPLHTLSGPGIILNEPGKKVNILK